MLEITNKSVIEYILGVDPIMAIQSLDCYRLKYDFIKQDIILINKDNNTIGVYNLLPNRMTALQDYIDNSIKRSNS